ADPWRDRAEGEAPDVTRYAHVTLSDFVADRAAFLASPHPIGLRIEPGDRVEDIGADVERFASIAINFPAFTDGRGYSSARLLRERMGFTGELRAVGDILTDQIPFLRRCGIDAMVVNNAPTREALAKDALAEVS